MYRSRGHACYSRAHPHTLHYTTHTHTHTHAHTHMRVCTHVFERVDAQTSEYKRMLLRAHERMSQSLFLPRRQKAPKVLEASKRSLLCPTPCRCRCSGAVLFVCVCVVCVCVCVCVCVRIRSQVVTHMLHALSHTCDRHGRHIVTRMWHTSVQYALRIPGIPRHRSAAQVMRTPSKGTRGGVGCMCPPGVLPIRGPELSG